MADKLPDRGNGCPGEMRRNGRLRFCCSLDRRINGNKNTKTKRGPTRETDQMSKPTEQWIQLITWTVTLLESHIFRENKANVSFLFRPIVICSELSQPADIHVGRLVKFGIIVQLLSSILTFVSLSSSSALSSCFSTQVCCFSLGFSPPVTRKYLDLQLWRVLGVDVQ